MTIINSQLLHSIKNPTRSNFMVTHEIFASEIRSYLANWQKNYDWNLKTPASKIFYIKPGEDEEMQKNQYLQNCIRTHDEEVDKLFNQLEQDKKCYTQFKKFFEEKIKDLGIKNPLIFFDDMALRIDIGYGSIEFNLLFKEFYVLFSDSRGFKRYHPSKEFYDYCINKDYIKGLQSELNTLLALAKVEFSKALPKRKLFFIEKQSFDEKLFIEKCLGKGRGLIVGEGNHESNIAKSFLIDNMGLFKAQGVTRIYMEHLFHERHQLLLDFYLNSPIDADLPVELKLYLAYLDEQFRIDSGSSFTEVVISAKLNGIRIISIDSEASYSAGSGRYWGISQTIERCSAMNIAMLQRFKEYDDGEKYIAFMGSAHVGTCLGVPGVSDLLCCPNIVIADLKDGKTETLEQNVIKDEVSFDILYHRGSKRTPSHLTTVSLLESNTELSSANSGTTVQPLVNHLEENVKPKADVVPIDDHPEDIVEPMAHVQAIVNLPEELMESKLSEQVKKQIAKLKAEKPTHDLKKISALPVNSNNKDISTAVKQEAIQTQANLKVVSDEANLDQSLSDEQGSKVKRILKEKTDLTIPRTPERGADLVIENSKKMAANILVRVNFKFHLKNIQEMVAHLHEEVAPCVRLVVTLN